MSSAAAAVYLLARLLLMSDDGTELLSEHRAMVPTGGTGLVRESLERDGFPGEIHIYLSPRAAPDAGADTGERPSLRVDLRVALWERAAEAAAGRSPRETSQETLEISPGGSALVQLAEDAPRGRRLMLSLSSPPEPRGAARPAPALPPQPGPIGFRIEAYRGIRGARELLEQHLLLTVERRPVTWESRWKQPIAGSEGQGVAYRDEGLTLRLLPVITRSGWISVEARLSAVLYATDLAEPLTPSSQVTRTVPLGIPFEISLDLPPERGGDGGGQGDAEESPSIVIQVTPYRPAG